MSNALIDKQRVLSTDKRKNGRRCCCGTQASTCKLICSHFGRLERKQEREPQGRIGGRSMSAPPASKKGSGTDTDGTVADPEEWGEASVLPRRKKTGGRKKGTPNKKNAARAELLASLKVSGHDPIAFFTSILRNKSAPLDLRFASAKELAPYVHPKLSSIEARTGGACHEDRLQRLMQMMEDDRPSTEGGHHE